jgi:glyoxylase-like metal-dependent hydrolase (beta-lactamase superfamily II)
VSPRIDRVVTSGQFCLDGRCWDVDNNIWLIGDDTEVLVVDAAHTAQPIIDAVSDRKLVAVLCTHAHNDHVTVAPELVGAFRCAGSPAPGRRGAVEADAPLGGLVSARRRSANYRRG